MSEIKTYLKITVDVNDGDYEVDKTLLTKENRPQVELFLEKIKLLSDYLEDNYHYRDGKKVLTGKILRFNHERIGNDEECFLKSITYTDGYFGDEVLTTEEIYEEGLILQEDYDILAEFLPMYANEGWGFHTIISIEIVEEYVKVLKSNYLEEL
ncbi:hypothetical protein [Pseudoalteromonas phage PH357]|nr:hypothetical protein [Pseudoalteromonas phage PH357]